MRVWLKITAQNFSKVEAGNINCRIRPLSEERPEEKQLPILTKRRKNVEKKPNLPKLCAIISAATSSSFSPASRYASA